jgi:hypothetical protein
LPDSVTAQATGEQKKSVIQDEGTLWIADQVEIPVSFPLSRPVRQIDCRDSAVLHNPNRPDSPHGTSMSIANIAGTNKRIRRAKTQFGLAIFSFLIHAQIFCAVCFGCWHGIAISR